MSSSHSKVLWVPLYQGYGLAWISHFWIEKNKPATWQYPGYSFAGTLQLFINCPFKHKV